ncbi:hypothetical protein Prubr_62640 [Polymorphospora rubra]|uniref:Uncharacterized protein n=1 Tax=Polymorphospora rubra TaxID=338584 RepID=A0A810NCL5_9ACTN|nr:hypothetical protein Prubr_62640 [Polymorphospora rubra]
MRLDHVDVGGGEPGTLQGLADDPLLGGAVGGGEATAGAVLVDGTAPDHGKDAPAVALGVGEPLHQEHADAFGPAGTVRVGGERLAAAVGGEPTLPGELDEGAGGGHHADPAGDREGAFAVAQRLPGEMQCYQRGRAGGVDGDRRAFQPEGVGDPAGDDAGGGAGEHVALDPVGQATQHRGVVLAGGADEDPGAAAAQLVGGDAGAFEHLPGALQQQPLLRVHRQGLAGRDAEEARVEVPGVAQEAAPVGVRGAGVVRVRVVQPGEVPAPVVGEGADGVGAGGDEVPQVLGRADPAGEAARHADDRDRLRLRVLQVAQAPVRLAELGGHPLEVFEEPVFVRHDPPARSLLPIDPPNTKKSTGMSPGAPTGVHRWRQWMCLLVQYLFSPLVMRTPQRRHPDGGGRWHSP